MRAAAAALALAILAAAPAARAQDEGPLVLRVGLLKRGLEGWERTGSEKAFAWSKEDATLAVKGQGGKDPPRLLYPKSWERFEWRFQVKKGLKKARLLVKPEGIEPIGIDLPGSAVKAAGWGDVALRVEPGRASLRVPDGAGEKEVAGVDLPKAARYGVGLEAASGVDAVLCGMQVVVRYVDGPPLKEEGFDVVFPGTNLGPWRPLRREMQDCFRAEDGLLVGEVRELDGAVLALEDRPRREYELRLRALWATTDLEIRAAEVPGKKGGADPEATAQVKLLDALDPETWNDIVVRVEGTLCTASVNGKRVFEKTVTLDRPAIPIQILLPRGKRCYLRDLRIKDLGR